MQRWEGYHQGPGFLRAARCLVKYKLQMMEGSRARPMLWRAEGQAEEI